MSSVENLQLSVGIVENVQCLWEYCNFWPRLFFGLTMPLFTGDQFWVAVWAYTAPSSV